VQREKSWCQRPRLKTRQDFNIKALMDHVWIDSNPKLEAILDGPGDSPRVILAHPHPLYGGDMHNHVVKLASDIAVDKGYTTIRFNFRGTGKSQGEHTQGEGELEDLDTVVRYAKDVKILIGYSFGAWIIARYASQNPLRSVLISPPSTMFEFPALKETKTWIIAGTNDQFSAMHALGSIVKEDRIILCDGADHFWLFGTECMKKALSNILAGL